MAGGGRRAKGRAAAESGDDSCVCVWWGTVVVGRWVLAIVDSSVAWDADWGNCVGQLEAKGTEATEKP